MGWRSIYVFISSTFNDMHAERDLLVKRVFPELKAYFTDYHINIVDIDLRWGISQEEAIKNNNVVGKCLENIDKARPLFLCLLGQRYGWQPGQEFLKDSGSQFPGLLNQNTSLYSVTEHEINHALFSQYHSQHNLEKFKPVKNALFYKRNADYLKGFSANAPEQLKRIYSDGFEKDSEFLQELKNNQQRLEQKISESHTIKNYSCKWDSHQQTPELALPLTCPGESESDIQNWKSTWEKSAGFVPEGNTIDENSKYFDVATAYNKALCEQRLADFKCEDNDLAEVIKADIIKVIEKELNPSKPACDSEKETLAAEHEKNLFDILQNNVFTTDDTVKLINHVEASKNTFCLLAAKAGAGKTTYLANFIQHYKANYGKRIIYRFAGLNDSSIDLITLLRSILKEAVDYRESDIQYLTDDEILMDWTGWLESLVQDELVIVIDGIDQLENSTTLSWIPEVLPAKVKLILSIKSDDEVEHKLLKDLRKTNQVIDLQPLNNANKKRIIDNYLGRFLKSLDHHQVDDVLNLEGVKAVGAPLYLQILLSELRVFGSFFQLQQYIEQNWGPTPVSAFKQKLQRMVTDRFYSPIALETAVPAVLQMLANARRGLSTEELTEALHLHLIKQQGKEFSRTQCADSVMLVINQMRPFVNMRSGRFFIFYQSLKQAVNELWLNKESQTYWHGVLSIVFDTGKKERRLSELPYHLTVSLNQHTFIKEICSHRFINDKIEAGLFNELFADFRSAVLVFSESALIHEFFSFIKKHYALLTNYSAAFAQTALNEPVNSEVRKCIKKDLMPFSYNWINSNEYSDPVDYSLPLLNNQNGITFNNSNILAITTKDSKLLILDYESGQIIQNKILGHQSISLSRFSEGLFYFYSAYSKSIYAYKISPFQQVGQFKLRYQPTCFNVSNQGNFIAVTYGIETELFDNHGQSLFIIRHNSTINQTAFSPRNKYLATASSDKTIRVTNLEDEKVVWFSHKHYDEVHSLCFSNDEKYLVSGSIDEIIIWDVERKMLLKRLPCHVGLITAISVSGSVEKFEINAVSANGILVIADIESGITRVADLNKGALTQLYSKPEGQIVVVNNKHEAFLINKELIANKELIDQHWKEWCCDIHSNNETGDITAVFGNSNGEVNIYESNGVGISSKKTLDTFSDQVMDIALVNNGNEFKAISGDGYLLDVEKVPTYGTQIDYEYYIGWEAKHYSQIAKGSLLSLLANDSDNYSDVYVSDYKGNVQAVTCESLDSAKNDVLFSFKNQKVIGLFHTSLENHILANTGTELHLLDVKNVKAETKSIDSDVINRFVCHDNNVFSITRSGIIQKSTLSEFCSSGKTDAHLNIDFISDSVVDFSLHDKSKKLLIITRKGYLIIYCLNLKKTVNTSKLCNSLKSVAISHNNQALALAGSNGFKGILSINNEN